jgi:hypothetical protein
VNSVCSHTVTLKLDSVASLWVLFGSVDEGRDEGRVVTKMVYSSLSRVETARSVEFARLLHNRPRGKDSTVFSFIFYLSFFFLIKNYTGLLIILVRLQFFFFLTK